jgi:hypothetical protein
MAHLARLALESGALHAVTDLSDTQLPSASSCPQSQSPLSDSNRALDERIQRASEEGKIASALATSWVAKMQQVQGWATTLVSQLGQDTERCHAMNVVRADAVDVLRAALRVRTDGPQDGEYVIGSHAREYKPSFEELIAISKFQPMGCSKQEFGST